MRSCSLPPTSKGARWNFTRVAKSNRSHARRRGGAALAQNWPQFPGAQASGVAEKAYIPVQLDVTKGTNVRWKIAIPGVAVSSPIVWAEHVFISTEVGGDACAGLRTGLYGDVEPSNDTSKHSSHGRFTRSTAAPGRSHGSASRTFHAQTSQPASSRLRFW
jgi:hypothetical protein